MALFFYLYHVFISIFFHIVTMCCTNEIIIVWLLLSDVVTENDPLPYSTPHPNSAKPLIKRMC